MKSWRKLLGAVFCLFVLLLPGASRAATTVRVQTNLFRFCPATSAACTPNNSPSVVYVSPGDTVEWFYNDPGCDAIVVCPGHNVTFADGPSSATVKGNTLVPVYPDTPVIFTRTFLAAGTYQYWCSLHRSFGMTGTIIVGSGGGY
jgi:plastocyanin